MRRALPLIALGLVGCIKLHKFPDAAPVWVDDDRHHVEDRPKKYWSGLQWDAIEQTAFVPVFKALSLDLPGAANNVNAWDEVPDSSWFHNRIGLRHMSLDDVAQGACPEQRLDPKSTWRVVAAKPNGANPGFIIKDADGRGWLLKMDGHEQPERATAADVFGSRLYHAAGYYAPCNIVVFFESSVLSVDPEAETTDDMGRDRPMTDDDVQMVLAKAGSHPDGRLRASASLFVDGRPIGPWRFQGTRKDDPNDVLRHEDRRELRGSKLLAAWLNHFDAREQNTLSVWANEDGRTYVRHYMLDFGDSFGSIWEDITPYLSVRFGYSYYLDMGHVLTDFITFGATQRPWESVQKNEVAPALGWYEAQHFKPQKWKAGYPNPAFTAMRDEDAAWMARIIARLSDAHVEAMLDEARMHDRVLHDELLRIVLARRDRILAHYLRERSPLADPVVQGVGDQATVCVTDLGVTSGTMSAQTVRYSATSYEGRLRKPVWHEVVAGTPDGSGGFCTAIRNGGGYQVLDLHVVEEPGMAPISPLRLHFIPQSDGSLRLAGIERPKDATAPGKGKREPKAK